MDERYSGVDVTEQPLDEQQDYGEIAHRLDAEIARLCSSVVASNTEHPDVREDDETAEITVDPDSFADGTALIVTDGKEEVTQYVLHRDDGKLYVVVESDEELILVELADDYEGVSVREDIANGLRKMTQPLVPNTNFSSRYGNELVDFN